MNIIELHILQSFPVTCLNRDDLGAPKSAIFGGVERARISSQCWKRAVREYAHETQPSFSDSVRTKRLNDAFLRVAQEVMAEASEEERNNVVSLILGTNKKAKGNVVFLFGKNDGETGVDTLFYISEQMMKNLISFVAEKLQKDKKFKPSFAELSNVLNSQVFDAADIAMFGRMVAADPSLTVEGAALFSHALSTHAVRSELDFFSAVDDEKKKSEDAGAGQIGTIEYNSACYYRYIGINLDLLAQSNFFNQAERKSVLENFIKAAILAVPGARKNSMFGANPPAYVMAVKRVGQPLSLANAFEKPIVAKHGGGYVAPSIEALEKEWKVLKSVFGVDGGVEVKVVKGKDGTETLADILEKLLSENI